MEMKLTQDVKENCQKKGEDFPYTVTIFQKICVWGKSTELNLRILFSKLM